MPPCLLGESASGSRRAGAGAGQGLRIFFYKWGRIVTTTTLYRVPYYILIKRKPQFNDAGPSISGLEGADCLWRRLFALRSVKFRSRGCVAFGVRGARFSVLFRRVFSCQASEDCFGSLATPSLNLDTETIYASPHPEDPCPQYILRPLCIDIHIETTLRQGLRTYELSTLHLRSIGFVEPWGQG